MGVFLNGEVAVGVTPTLIATVQLSGAAILVANLDAVQTIFVGGPNVTTATGFPIAKGTSVPIPCVGGQTHDLYGIVAATTANAAWIQPA
jgi:hypothetical protein